MKIQKQHITTFKD